MPVRYYFSRDETLLKVVIVIEDNIADFSGDMVSSHSLLDYLMWHGSICIHEIQPQDSQFALILLCRSQELLLDGKM